LPCAVHPTVISLSPACPGLISSSSKKSIGRLYIIGEIPRLDLSVIWRANSLIGEAPEMPNWLLSAGGALDDDERREEEYRRWKAAQPLRRDTIERLMATLDDIAQERQRLADRLARLDAERLKLAELLAELETAERVLARLSRPRSTGRTRGPVAQSPTETRRGRLQKAKPTLSLGDATLRAILALGNGVSAEEVRNYLGQELEMQVRANHLGRALQRHQFAGKLEQRESRWWSAEPPTEAPPVPPEA
jgi:hypothetical protein